MFHVSLLLLVVHKWVTFPFARTYDILICPSELGVHDPINPWINACSGPEKQGGEHVPGTIQARVSVSEVEEGERQVGQGEAQEDSHDHLEGLEVALVVVALVDLLQKRGAGRRALGKDCGLASELVLWDGVSL